MSAPLDLDSIGQVAREGSAPAGLLAGVVTTPLPARIVTCPYCGDQVDGLLAPCSRPRCRRIEILDDHRFARSQDQ